MQVSSTNSSEIILTSYSSSAKKSNKRQKTKNSPRKFGFVTSLMNVVTSYFWKRDVTSSGKKLAAAQTPLIIESSAHRAGQLSGRLSPTPKLVQLNSPQLSVLRRNFEAGSYFEALNKTSEIPVKIVRIDDNLQKADDSLMLENKKLVNGRFVTNQKFKNILKFGNKLQKNLMKNFFQIFFLLYMKSWLVRTK